MQTRMDSFMESLVNIAIGLVISTVANWLLLGLYLGYPMHLGANVLISVVFTALSLIRSYCIRRAFNGRSVWSVIKDKINAAFSHRQATGVVDRHTGLSLARIAELRLAPNDPIGRSSADYFYWR